MPVSFHLQFLEWLCHVCLNVLIFSGIYSTVCPCKASCSTGCHTNAKQIKTTLMFNSRQDLLFNKYLSAIFGDCTQCVLLLLNLFIVCLCMQHCTVEWCTTTPVLAKPSCRSFLHVGFCFAFLGRIWAALSDCELEVLLIHFCSLLLIYKHQIPSDPRLFRGDYGC